MPEPGALRCAQGETRGHAPLPGSHSGHTPAQVSVPSPDLLAPGTMTASAQGGPCTSPAAALGWGPPAGCAPQQQDHGHLGKMALRILPVSHSLTDPEAAANVLAAATRTLTQYPFDFRGARILSAQDEGVFGWVTANYLLENFIKVGPVASPMSQGCGHPPTG